MRIPSPFIPSSLSRKMTYNLEGKVQADDRVSQGKWPSMGSANSMYPTEAERFDSITPFMKAAKLKDASRRNYVIQPGGAAVYFDNPPDMVEAIYGTPSTAHIPTDQDSFSKGLSQGKPATMGRPMGGG